MTSVSISSKKAALVACASIVAVLLSAIFVSTWNPLQGAQALSYKGVTREFYLTNMDNVKINETSTGLPADIFNIPEMTVKKGDTVVIHLYNVEPEVDDRHSFTMLEGPYATNNPLDGGQNKTITFTANQTGIFQYVCVYHMPSMTGQLVVAPVTIDEFRAQQQGEHNSFVGQNLQPEQSAQIVEDSDYYTQTISSK